MRVAAIHRTPRSGEQGFVTIVMGLGIVALAGFAALAVDLGYLHMKRSDLQTAADTAALAGATALLSYQGNPSAIRAVVLDYARRNLVQDDEPTVAVTDDDVLLLDADGAADPWNAEQVELTIRRSRERGNAVALFFGRILGMENAEISATARAALTPACNSRCVKPFIVPTKFQWDDHADAPSAATYGNGELDVDSEAEMASVVVLGYDDADVGAPVRLKYGNPADIITPSQYSAVDYPPVNKGTPATGAAVYKENIAGCEGSNNVLLEIGDELYLEPGNMVGPTDTGLRQLLAKDPYAYFDESTGAILGSDYPDPLASPRVAIVAFYDPRQPPTSGRNTLFVYQLGAVFIEDVAGSGEIDGRFMHTVARSPKPTEDRQCLTRMARLVLDSSRQAALDGQ